MVVRMLAVLVTLGLLVSAADAREPSASPTAAALVEQVDDSAEDVALALPSAPIPEEFRDTRGFTVAEPPAGHQPCLYVFRPPRSYAFN